MMIFVNLVCAKVYIKVTQYVNIIKYHTKLMIMVDTVKFNPMQRILKPFVAKNITLTVYE